MEEGEKSEGRRVRDGGRGGEGRREEEGGEGRRVRDGGRGW
jgi:hypothetical protein